MGGVRLVPGHRERGEVGDEEGGCVHGVGAYPRNDRSFSGVYVEKIGNCNNYTCNMVIATEQSKMKKSSAVATPGGESRKKMMAIATIFR